MERVLAELLACSLGTDPETDPRSRVRAAMPESANQTMVDHWLRGGGVEELEDLYERWRHCPH